jgi:3-oxoacyl-[acyl-carrier protein] reductase
VVGSAGNAGQVNYASSKGGINSLTRSIAAEFGHKGVRVNAVAPGFIETDMTGKLPHDIKEELIKNILLGFFGKTEDVACAVAWLSSPESDYITGQIIHVNGGLYL